MTGRPFYRFTACFVVLLAASTAQTATAQLIEWNNNTGTIPYLDLAGNWTPSGTPQDTNSARFNIAGSYEVWWDAVTENDVPQMQSLEFLDGNVTFENVATIAPTQYKLELLSGSNGMALRGSSTSLTLRGLELESSGGTSIRDGATLTIDGSHAQGSTLTESGSIWLGDLGVGTPSGTLNIVDGGVISGGATGSGNMRLNDSSLVVIRGTGSQASLDYASVNENSSLQILEGASLTTSSGPSFLQNIGSGAGTSTLLVDGAGSQWTSSGGMSIARSGNGILTVSNGGVVDGTSLAIGSGVTPSGLRGSGTINVDGAGSQANYSGNVYLGSFGDGNLHVTNGGYFTSQTLRVATDFVENTGTASISDTGSVVALTGFLEIGEQSDGYVIVESGGHLITPETRLENGAMIVRDSGSLVESDIIEIGKLHNAALEIRNGGTVSSSFMEVGNNGRLLVQNGAEVTTQQLRINGELLLGGGTINVLDPEAVLQLDRHAFQGPDPTLVLNSSELHVAGQTVFGVGLDVIVSGASFTSGSVINDGNIRVLGPVVMGSNSRHDGYSGNGTLDVGGAFATLNDAGLADLGRLTNLDLGTLTAANGIAIGSGEVISGRGTIEARVSGDSGSAIYASGGNLTIGDATHVAGFSSTGELYTGSNQITVLDANQARLGSYTELGDASGSGLLRIDNGAVINFGDNLVGYGTIDNQNLLETAIINNGTMQGNSVVDRLIVEGYVKGVGTFDNVQFNGTFAPGLSPTCIDGTNFFFGTSSILEMELGGLIRCAEHDAIRATGLLALDGTLDVLLINGFNPELGNSFDLFDWGTIDGEFAAFDLPTLDTGLRWDLSDLYSTGTLSVSAVPEPNSVMLLGLVAAVAFCRRRRV